MTNKILDLADAYAQLMLDGYAESFSDFHTPKRKELAAAIKEEQDYTRAVISERDQLGETMLWQAGRISELIDARDELNEMSMWQNVCINKHIDAIDTLTSERDAMAQNAANWMHKASELEQERDEFNALMHKALDERDHFIRERDGLCAARMAYASEFQCDVDGLPDVGSVHQNIRALKAERDKLTMVHAERTVERDRLREVAQQALECLDAGGMIGRLDTINALRKEIVK